MSKKLISATILIIVAEVISLSRVYLTEGADLISPFISGIILTVSIIMEIVGVILLFICISQYGKKK